jgi:DNA-binding CsgD family transcriptional regulator
VATAWARRRLLERIAAVEERDVTGLRQQVLDLIREVVPYDAHIWLLTDPVTAVGAAPHAVVPCLPELPALIKAKYLTPVGRWTTQTATTATLHGTTHGELSQSRSWRDVMSRYGVRDVLSTVFRDQFGTWGFLELWRIAPAGPFSEEDADLLVDIAPVLTQAIRQAQAATFQPDSATHRQDLGPVVLTLDDDLRILSRTAASQVWLDQLLPPTGGNPAVPASVYNVAAQLLATEQGVDDHHPYSRTHLRDGLWLSLRAARITGEDQQPGQIVVTLQEASGRDRLEVWSRAVGLTMRERKLICLLAAGGNTRSIAAAMDVSENTVQDHLKSVFTKTGSRDRIAVLAQALGTSELGR